MSSPYEQQILAWRAARRARLVAEDGWLSILAKVRLREGVSRVGSDPANDVVLPGVAPAQMGTLRSANGEVSIEAAPDVPLESLDKERWALGSLRFEVMRRGPETYLRVKDANSKARLAFGEIPYFPIDPALRVIARLEPYTPTKKVELDYEEGLHESYESPGRAVFELEGATYSLDPVLDHGTPRLYVLVRDLTSRDSTYGAGRFLYAPLPSDGAVVLDFNQAFNPPCAFTHHVSCPIVPLQNRLNVAIRAGEKRPVEGPTQE